MIDVSACYLKHLASFHIQFERHLTIFFHNELILVAGKLVVPGITKAHGLAHLTVTVTPSASHLLLYLCLSEVQAYLRNNSLWRHVECPKHTGIQRVDIHATNPFMIAFLGLCYIRPRRPVSLCSLSGPIRYHVTSSVSLVNDSLLSCRDCARGCGQKYSVIVSNSICQINKL